MKKTILEIYALTVCFVTVVCFVATLGVALYSVLEVINPDFTIDSWQYAQHQTNDAYWKRYSEPPILIGPAGQEIQGEKKVRPSESELTKQREASYAEVLSSERRSGAQTLVKCIIILLINTVVFTLHWFIARRAQASAV